MLSKYSGLNGDQKKFVDCYVDGAVSGADAVVEAGFAHFEGFTEHDVAQRLLASPKIQAAIAERVKVVHDKGVADQFWLLRRIVDYLNMDIRDVYNPDGTLKRIHDWPAALRGMVKSLKMDKITGAITDVSFEGKTKMYELFGRLDEVGAFSKESEGGDTVVVVRDMTAIHPADEAKTVVEVVVAEPQELEAD